MISPKYSLAVNNRPQQKHEDYPLFLLLSKVIVRVRSTNEEHDLNLLMNRWYGWVTCKLRLTVKSFYLKIERHCCCITCTRRNIHRFTNLTNFRELCVQSGAVSHTLYELEAHSIPSNLDPLSAYLSTRFLTCRF